MATKTSNFSIISFGVGQIPVSIKGHLFGSAIVFYYNVGSLKNTNLALLLKRVFKCFCCFWPFI